MRRRFLQLDVFSERTGTGNPLAVVVDSEGLDTPDMQAIAAWLNLSETIFFLPADEPDHYRIRIFTPRQELPFAGHPSVGAAWAAIELGLTTPNEERLVIQHCAAGTLPVRVVGSRWFRQLHVRSPEARQKTPAISALPPQLEAITPPGSAAALWSNGPDWWLLPIRSEAELRRYTPELDAIARLPDSGKLAIYAAADRPDVGYQYAVRTFAPGVGIDEDPVTGSANALIAARLLDEGRLTPGSQYVASQGRERGRNGQIHLQVDDNSAVWVGGSVQPVIDGHIEW